MSHFTSYQTELKDVKTKTVEDAVSEIAKQMDAQVIHELQSNYWSGEDILIGLKTKDCSQGIGVRVKDGELTIVGDSYMQPGFNRLKNLITNTTKMMKIKAKAKKHKYRTKLNITREKVQLRAWI